MLATTTSSLTDIYGNRLERIVPLDGRPHGKVPLWGGNWQRPLGTAGTRDAAGSANSLPGHPSRGNFAAPSGTANVMPCVGGRLCAAVTILYSGLSYRGLRVPASSEETHDD